MCPRTGEAVAPLYIVMYPTAVAGAIGVVNCQHQPLDNCPEHGPALSGLAQAVAPGVYGGGVWGHDHLLAGPGAGGDFHVAHVPVVVLFNSLAVANNHITTLAQLNAAVAAASQVTEIPIPPATFHGSVVSERTYDHATPLPPAPPLP